MLILPHLDALCAAIDPVRCPSCALTREERDEGGCPMVYPQDGCPFYDPPRMTDIERQA